MNSLFDWLIRIIQGLKLWVVVRPWERAVRVRLGKHAEVLDKGVHLKLPFIDDVTLFNSRLRIASFPNQTLTTADGFTVSVAGNVGFRVAEPLEAMLSLQQPEYSCAALVQTSASSFVVSRRLEEIDPTDLQEFAKDELQRAAGGLSIEYVSLTDFAKVNRTFRLLGDEWRPSTRPDTHDKDA